MAKLPLERWALVLAGGDGTRLKSLTRQIVGHEMPKQFCPIIGEKSLLEETLDRVSLVVAPNQTMVLGKSAASSILPSHGSKWFAPRICGRTRKPGHGSCDPPRAAPPLPLRSERNSRHFPFGHYIGDVARIFKETGLGGSRLGFCHSEGKG